MTAAPDQAEGLRRLLTAGRPRIVALLGMAAGVGVTTAAMNLAVAAARAGAPVLLLDEHAGDPASACANWELAGDGASPAGAAPAVKVLAARPDGARPAFDLRALCAGGLILIDVALDEAGQMSPLARLADEVVIVMQASAASITAAYAGLKRLHHRHALQTFRFVVAKVLSEQQARLVTANVVNTSSRFLAVSLQPLGWVPADALVGDARLRRRAVCEVHPASPAAHAYRHIASALWPAGPGAGAAGEGLARRHAAC